MIRVLHLIDTTGPGGAETVFVRLLQHLDKDRYQHLVVLRGEGWVADQVRKAGLSPVFIDSKGSFNIKYVLSLVRLIRRQRIQLLHAHLLGSNVYGAIAALCSRIPMIATFHGNVDVAAQERMLGLKFRLINAGANAIVCVSKRLHDDLNARSPLTASKLRLIHNGVDEKDYSGPVEQTLRQELGLSEAVRLVISVGNIRPAKGYQHLVEAASLLKDSSALDYHFLVVGHPKKELYEALLSQVRDAGVEKTVHFLGFRENVSGLLRQADVFLLPSLSEGFSISTVEAMMAGVPIVATRSGGPEEILEDGRTALLVAPGEAEAIVGALTRLESPEVAGTLATNAGQDARARFSLQAMVDAYAGLYAEMTGSPVSPAYLDQRS